ncbi:MAG: DUF3847 domain-containing protein [Lachnospiraceae bacterium]|nr:DUF3847 domain-containing protein [Tyzzerella sp.]MBQ6993951.1 DUF3847 domain-containing protein [Lachnospiraceae bacterium]
MARSYEEKISNIDLEIEQLKNRKREITQRHKAEERKARTKRLIERGAILESLIPASDTLTNDDVKQILSYALETPYVKDYLRKYHGSIL